MKAMLMTRVKAALGACLVGGLLLLGDVFGCRALDGDKARAAPAEKKKAPDDKALAQCDNKLRDTLLVLDKQFWEATSRHDMDTLSKLLADDSVAFNPGGRHWNKNFTLKRYRETRHSNVKFPTGKSVVRLNKHTALLTYEVVWGAVDKGAGRRPGLGHDRMISCWVQRDGGWFLRYTECINRYNFPDRRASAVRPPAPRVSTRFVLSPSAKAPAEARDKVKRTGPKP
jgi:hypothetical protein